jgi:hypothetical protein
MRLDIGFDDDARYLRREQAPDRSTEREFARRTGAPGRPGPLDRRDGELREQADQNRFPEIPRRQYEGIGPKGL